MNSIVYLASKYLNFKASDRGLSTIAVIALLTIVISNAAAVVILSAANGFHENFIKKLMTKDAHITILGPGKGIPDYKSLILELKKVKGVKSVIPFFDKQALLRGRFNVWGSFVKAIPADFYSQDTNFDSQFVVLEGEFDINKPHSIVLGDNLALNLGASVGSYIYLTVYSDDFFSMQYKFRVTGIFSAGYAEYDSSLSFISFKDAQEIFESKGYAYGLAVEVADPMHVEKYMPDIGKVCSYSKWTWKNTNRNNLIALENEKMLIYIILTLFFTVVGFNILSTMIAMVLDKKEEIGILKAMGLKPGGTLQVFLFVGFLLGTIGSFLGTALGLLITIGLNGILRGIEIYIDLINNLAYIFVFWIHPIPKPAPFHFFKSSVYYLTQFPIAIELNDLIFIVGLSVILATLAVIIPSRKAAKMRPVEVLRND